MDNLKHDTIRAIIWQTDDFLLLDQRLLPQQELYITCSTIEDAAKGIKDMVVRGAPAIGVTAAYGIVLAARDRFQQDPSNWQALLDGDLAMLAESRPTAVNLFWAIAQMKTLISEIDGDPTIILLEKAKRIHEEDIAANYKMGEFGASLIDANSNILTHCNTGSLATGGYGTALGVIRSAYSRGKIQSLYADETRPWLQGARLTAWECVKDQIPVELIVEGAASSLMQKKKIDWVIVGSDRIAGNGDVANKIGTFGLAVLAKYHGVKFMVVAPTTTVDMSLASGDEIPIEYRDEQELLNYANSPLAAEGARAWNPVFDVTPASLIDAIITEAGVVEQPTTEKMLAMMKKA